MSEITGPMLPGKGPRTRLSIYALAVLEHVAMPFNTREFWQQIDVVLRKYIQPLIGFYLQA